MAAGDSNDDPVNQQRRQMDGDGAVKAPERNRQVMIGKDQRHLDVNSQAKSNKEKEKMEHICTFAGPR